MFEGVGILRTVRTAIKGIHQGIDRDIDFKSTAQRRLERERLEHALYRNQLYNQAAHAHGFMRVPVADGRFRLVEKNDSIERH